MSNIDTDQLVAYCRAHRNRDETPAGDIVGDRELLLETLRSLAEIVLAGISGDPLDLNVRGSRAAWAVGSLIANIEDASAAPPDELAARRA